MSSERRVVLGSIGAQSQALLRLVEELMLLLQETADYHRRRNEQIGRLLDDVVQSLRRICRRIRRLEQRYVVAFVGSGNVGKSTLLNAVLGYEAAPRRNGPCTAAPIGFEAGERIVVTEHQRQRIQRRSWSCADVGELQRKLASLADDEGAEASRSIRKVVVQLSSDVLRHHLVIADTPGFGAAQLGEADGAHEAALREYLEREVSQVFAVVLAEQGIGRRENQFFQQFLGNVCDDVVVTGSEDWSVDDRRRFRRRFMTELGGQAPRMHFVSGLLGVEARASGDDAALESAGIGPLVRHIASLAEPKGRLKALADQVLQIAEDVGEWLAEQRDEKNRPLQVRWRPDSWLRWQASQPTGDFKQRIVASLAGNAS